MSQNTRLFIVSLLGLFLELFLIRWISTEIRVFSYINNFVLLACFMGLGLGSTFSARVLGPTWTLVLVTLVVLMVRAEPFIELTERLAGIEGAVVWVTNWEASDWLTTATGIALVFYLFAAIALCFVPIGQMIGRMLDSSPKIVAAYSVNVLGSLVGIWLFSSMSYFYVPPIGWLLMVIALIFALVPRNALHLSVCGLGSALALLMILPAVGAFETVWSPYQRLSLRPLEVGREKTPNYLIDVNNVGYMRMVDLSDAFFARNPRQDVEKREIQHYVFPYLLRPGTKTLLIAGAGAGNDAAAALRNGVEHIDAVEIDPAIFEFGAKLHPEKPYADPRVNVVIDDARSFFKQATSRYDMVRLGLLDSHTKSSNNNNLRLDHYVYTQESLAEIRALLNEDGIFSLSFAAERFWIVQRLFDLIVAEFGKEPLVIEFTPSPTRIYASGGFQFLVGNGEVDVHALFAARPDLLRRVQQSPRARIVTLEPDPEALLPTDDWPYLYLEKAEVPMTFVLITGALVVLLFPLSRVLISRDDRFEWKFFFLGAAFLLMEFQNISKASLIFGATWMVNAYIFSAILSIILLANLVVHLKRDWNVTGIVTCLAASLVVLYLTPLSVFNALPLWIKSTAVVALLNLPIFFAGILFITLLDRTPNKKMAYGANLLGSAIGGILEPLSFVAGIKAVLLVVLVFYLAAFLLHRGSPGGVAGHATVGNGS
jgi:spermidine synthase